jgi:hypothetical protein
LLLGAHPKVAVAAGDYNPGSLAQETLSDRQAKTGSPASNQRTFPIEQWHDGKSRSTAAGLRGSHDRR